MRKPKIGIVSLGCPRNLVDSEQILGSLKEQGYPIVDIAEAEIGLVNTCGFIESAKQESIEVILDLVELKRKGSLRKIIVYGCLAQRYRDVLRKEFPEVDSWVGTRALSAGLARYALTPRHYAYLKICEGCVNQCSFCIIPALKPRFASLDAKTVVEQVRQFDAHGVKELNIIGQDLTGYGRDLASGPRLEALLRRIVGAARHIRWIRLLYLYPNRISDELLRIIAAEPKICKYVDVPLQHVNDRILAAMNRRTTQKQIAVLIEKVRKRIPGVALRTSLIVGFPGETERQFDQLHRFVRQARFERLGVFMYSREENTPAYSLAGQVPERIKRQRLDAIMRTQQDISRAINARFLGMRVPVMIDEKDNDRFIGRTAHDAPEVDGQVFVSTRRALRPGDIVTPLITDTLEYDLAGEL